MITILFNAFSFLQKKMRERNLDYANVTMAVPAGSTPRDLMEQFQLDRSDVEAVFVNGSVVSLDTRLADNDRVAFVPPGTPGPYRVMLGMVKRGESRKAD